MSLHGTWPNRIYFESTSEELVMGPSGMYVATVILFLIPWSILRFAWRDFLKSAKESTHKEWRLYFQKAALIVAAFATFTTMVIFLSWTDSGGSPHGGEPPPGLWLFLRPVAEWSVIATVPIGAFGTGRSRLLVLA